ncbi:MAG: hypothetical protein R3F31_21000 [Verrucomicrobiales bacterium]
MKFAHFYDGKSTKFEAATLENDFLEDFRTASDLAFRSRHAEALPLFTSLRSERTPPEFQKPPSSSSPPPAHGV